MYRYAFDNPARYTDPLGLDVRICCRPIKSWLLQKFNHCYIESNMNGRRETWGQYNIDGTGEPRKNYVDDRGTPRRCSSWYPETCEGNKCLTRNMNKYPVEDYSEVDANIHRLEGRNSNTFVRCLWERCRGKMNPGDYDDVMSMSPGRWQPCPAF